MNYRRIRARINALVLPLVNRARWRWRRRTAPPRAYIVGKIEGARRWWNPPPRKPSPAEQAHQDFLDLQRDARRRRLHWARGPFDPALTQAAQPNPEVMRALVGPWRGS